MTLKAFADDLTKRYRFIHMIRGGEEAEQYGDPWKNCVCCGSNDGITAELFGYCGEVSLELVRMATWVAKHDLGYRKVFWERKRESGSHIATPRVGKSWHA